MSPQRLLILNQCSDFVVSCTLLWPKLKIGLKVARYNKNGTLKRKIWIKRWRREWRERRDAKIPLFKHNNSHKMHPPFSLSLSPSKKYLVANKEMRANRAIHCQIQSNDSEEYDVVLLRILYVVCNRHYSFVQSHSLASSRTFDIFK